ncbi:MAG: hypothetical protein JHD04_10280, partial [Nocardioides sp.]|nr:hypothetical protein [Nocardioides sp.]
MRADHYDDFAEAYARENESNLFNAHYERPAMLDLAGDVSGRRVLDVGCGAGALAQALDTQLASAQGDSAIRIGLTFQRKGGGWCRS